VGLAKIRESVATAAIVNCGHCGNLFGEEVCNEPGAYQPGQEGARSNPHLVQNRYSHLLELHNADKTCITWTIVSMLPSYVIVGASLLHP